MENMNSFSKDQMFVSVYGRKLNRSTFPESVEAWDNGLPVSSKHIYGSTEDPVAGECIVVRHDETTWFRFSSKDIECFNEWEEELNAYCKRYLIEEDGVNRFQGIFDLCFEVTTEDGILILASFFVSKGFKVYEERKEILPEFVINGDVPISRLS